MPLKSGSQLPAARRAEQVFREPVKAAPPVWLMRQAGRYLPEYRATRQQAGGFLDLCYAPKLAAEVTLQPIRRYGFDAAILFADILLVPHALGQSLTFEEGEGPRLDPVRTAADLARLTGTDINTRFSLVYEAVSLIRSALPAETALIGFCGAPWTVATYMVGGAGSPEQAEARLLAYRDPQLFQQLIDLLVATSVEYLCGQVAAGAGILQIFDSWAGSLPETEFGKWVVAPTRAIVDGVRSRYPQVPIIGFPRGAGMLAPAYVEGTKVDGIGCDTASPLRQLRDLSGKSLVQGNLDPLLLVNGGDQLDRRAEEIVAAMAGRRFIFNLGHGIVPQTPPDNVARLVETVRRVGSATR